MPPSIPFFALLVLTLIGCGGAEPARTDEPTSSDHEEHAEAESPEPVAEGTEPAPDLPTSREHAITTAEAFGTLPEGVGVAVGSDAPNARLANLEGQAVELTDLYRRGATMVVFYRGGWCPYCNHQIRQLTEDYAEFQRRGVSLVLISVDRIEEGARTRASWQIPFEVLSDPDLVAHRAFSVLEVVDEATQERYRSFGIDLEAASGRDHHTIAVPSVFVVDAEGHVLFAHADRDYRTRPSNAQLLEALDGLALSVN